MSKQRYINTKFWDDSYIIKLDPIEKLLFLYLLTNPLTNIAGIYEITLKRIAFDTGIDQDMTLNILNRFNKDKKAYFIDSWVILSNFPKYQNHEENPKIKQGIDLIIKELPINILESIYTLSIPYLYPLNYSNSNTNTNTNTNTDIVLEKKEFIKAEIFLKHYFAEYKRLIGDNLPIYSERIILPRIDATAGLFGGYEKLKKLLKIYFNEDNKFYKENRWSLTCFLSENILNKLNS